MENPFLGRASSFFFTSPHKSEVSFLMTTTFVFFFFFLLPHTWPYQGRIMIYQRQELNSERKFSSTLHDPSTPMPGNPSWSRRRFLRLIANNFRLEVSQEEKKLPNCSRKFTEQFGSIGVAAPPASGPLQRPITEKTRAKNADFDFKNPHWTWSAAGAFPNAPQLCPRPPPTIGEHLRRRPPRPWSAPSSHNRKTRSK